MAKHVIFVVHGIGTHGVEFHKSAIQALKASRRSLCGTTDADFNKRFEIVQLRYDDILQNYIAAYNSRSEALSAIGVPGHAPDMVRNVVTLASSGVDDNNVWIHNWGDVVLYLMTELGFLIQEKLWNRIIRKLNQRGLPSYTIIAHSLGTRVIHDILQRAFSDDTGGAYRLFGKPRALVQIANTVRLTSFDEGHLRQTSVYPSRDEQDGACYQYLNVWHPLDPIARIRQFQRSRYPVYAQATGFSDVETRVSDVIEIKEVHSLARYLEIPDVAAAVLNAIERISFSVPGPIDAEAVADARSRYEQTTVSGQWEAALETLETFDLTSIESWKEIRDLQERLQ